MSTILILLAVVIGVILALASRQPSEFRVTRTASMAAMPQTIFEQVNDLHKWDAWSPWARLDPNAKNLFEGPDYGPGAILRWEGNHKVGSGSMIITESREGELVKFRLEFLKPMKATNTAEFTFTPEGGGTKVTWSMYGPNSLMGKIMGLFMNCEKMVGGQFEQGLAQMKSIVEGSRA